ncbi:MAG: ribose 5-phosphate isomerase B [Bacteroidales bacterium]|nr:ribose 5-phosphate isomerase B [Bacteroidales bacterium]
MPLVSKTIAIGSDHGGYEMKEFIRKKLVAAGWDVKDFGTDSTQRVDYPDIIHPIASAVNGGVYEKAIILCGSGNGAQMTANKYPHVRAALCWNQEQASLSREHNDANVLSLPGRFIAFDVAWEMVLLFLNTDFEGGRHQLRVDKISKTI